MAEDNKSKIPRDLQALTVVDLLGKGQRRKRQFMRMWDMKTSVIPVKIAVLKGVAPPTREAEVCRAKNN